MATHYVNQVAPVNRHSPLGMSPVASGSQKPSDGADQYFTFTVGKLDAGMAILIGDRASQIEFPSLLLPSECTTGSVVRISVARNLDEEQRKKRDFDQLQRDVLETFGLKGPQAPSLQLRAVTQTSITLEWNKLDLASSKLLSLDIFRNNERLAAIPNPAHNTSTKLSGLEVDKPYSFHLVMRTTAGTFTSNVIKTKTHNMTDTSGISVCFGFMEGSHLDEDDNYVDGELEAGAKQLLQGLGAKWSDKIQIDTTHYVCTHPRSRLAPGFGENHPAGQMRGAMFSKAAQLSIPIVLPHWIYACAETKKLVPISLFYMDKEPPNADKVDRAIGRPAGTSSSMTAAKQSIAPDELAAGDQSQSIPPTPAPKDSPILASAAQGSVHEEGIEPAPHPVAEDQEGPATTTVAVPEKELASTAGAVGHADDGTPAVPVPTHSQPTGEGHLPASDSAGRLSLADDPMDEISLGGGSQQGDAADEEIDLS